MDERMKGWEEAARPFFEEIGQEVRIEETRRFILSTLEIRFGLAAVNEFEQTIQRIENLEQLKELHRRAAKGRLSQFRKAFPQS